MLRRRKRAATDRPSPLPAAYWRLWAASGISNLGDGVYMVALPLLAARLTRDEVSIAMVAVAAMLPWLALSLPIGALVDRFDRRRIMIVSDLTRALVVGALTAVVATERVEIWMLWLVALALGTCEVFFDNASQAIVPGLVAADQLHVANGRRYAVEFATNSFIGVPLGGVLFAAVTWLPFGVDAASFLLAALLVASIPGRFRPVVALEPRERRSMYAEVRTGVRFLWRDPLLRSIAITLGLTNLAFQIPQSVFVLFALDDLGVSESTLGVLLLLLGAGGIVGGVLGPRVVARFGPAATIRLAIGTWIVCLLLTWAVPEALLVGVTLGVSSMAATTWNVVTVTLRQEIVPSSLFGRVNSVYRFFGWGTLPIGAAIGGVLASFVGVRATWLIGAGVMAAALLSTLRHVRREVIERALDTSPTVSTTFDDTPLNLARDPWFDDL
jgi:MFS family permease